MLEIKPLWCVPFAFRARSLREETLARQASGGGGGWWENNRNVAVVVYSFTIYEAVLKKMLSVGSMYKGRCSVDVGSVWGRCGVDVVVDGKYI